MKKTINNAILCLILVISNSPSSFAATENHPANFDSYCADTASSYDTLVIIDNGSTTTTHCTTSDGTDLITATVNVATSHSVGGNRNPGGMGYYLNELNGLSYDGNWWQLWMIGNFSTSSSFGCTYSNPKVFTNWELSDCGISSFIPSDKAVYSWKFSNGSIPPQRRWTETTPSGGSTNSNSSPKVVVSPTPVSESPVSISKSKGGVNEIKLDLTKTYSKAKVLVFAMNSKNKLIKIGEQKANKDGNINFKSKANLSKSKKLVFKVNGKTVSELALK